MITLRAAHLRLPKISAYPLIDLALKTEHLTPAELVSTRDLFEKEAAKADSKSVRDEVNQMRVYCRTEVQGAAPIGQPFLTQGKPQ